MQQEWADPISVRVTREVADELDRRIREEGNNRSGVLRRVIATGLKTLAERETRGDNPPAPSAA